MAFLSVFADWFQLSSNTVELLKEQAFDCKTVLLGLSEENLKEVKGLKLGESGAAGCSGEAAVHRWRGPFSASVSAAGCST